MKEISVLLNKLENYVWRHLYYPPTNLICDGRTSLEANGNIADLPTPEEICSLEPNPCGWGTGMEDSMIHGGMLLSALVKEHKMTGDQNLKKKARDIYLGIKMCANVSNAKDFLARSVSPFDGKSYYINSSREINTLWQS